MSEKTPSSDSTHKFSEFLLASEMMLAKAMTQEPGEYENAFGWVNHIRHEFNRLFKVKDD